MGFCVCKSENRAFRAKVEIDCRHHGRTQFNYEPIQGRPCLSLKGSEELQNKINGSHRLELARSVTQASRSCVRSEWKSFLLRKHILTTN